MDYKEPSDLVARLRVELSDCYLATMTQSEARTAQLAREAADEIERLRADARLWHRVEGEYQDDERALRAEIERLRHQLSQIRNEISALKDARWAREDAWDRKLGGEDIDEILEERKRLRAGLQRITMCPEAGCAGCYEIARRLLGEEK